MVLYFNESGMLVNPDGGAPVTVGAFRVYFRITSFQGGDGTIALTITSNLDLPQGIEEVQGDKVQSTKLLRNGLLYIERNGKLYNAQGALME